MSASHTFTTILCWVENGEDREACAKVTYDFTPGYAGDRIDPPSDGEIDITEIVRTDPGDPIDFERWRSDDGLIQECFDVVHDDQIAAEEWRAEARRDDRMMEDWA